ncbi:MAG: ketoacyl-ACP synthase III [Planctomycetaceae bacterium]|nr:ketoacyl-ACP synthase III [Planctomycetales bacterium]MCB9875772.1 ketoacyl-ACP synthase III [Planctomycetaceae bacterium]MCB9939318.1 ketoacyl-ACP synthase III [Planctomycetaceae bacterium]HRX78576.1 beta-ketoacyl-ACP synthase III [Pirellulaceae bacterium]
MSTTIEPKRTTRVQTDSRRFHTLTGVQVLGTGAFAPLNVVRNEDLSELGFDPDWIIQRTGIHERRHALRDEVTSDLAFNAAILCLEAADVSVRDLDLILVGTVTPDRPMPSTACILQQKLGANAPAFDINAACSGFVYTLATGAQFVKTGHSKRVLVVGADVMSRIINPADKKTYPLFGDGAGAVLLGAGSDEQGFLSYMLGADGEGAGLLCVPAGGSEEPPTTTAIEAERQFMQMDGRAVFKWAIRTVSDAVRETLQHAGKSIKDVDSLILHQANIRIIDAVVDELGFDSRKVVINLEQYGNTSAGSIPLALAEADQQGRINRGDLVLMCGFGAGLTWGTALLRW